MDKNIRRLTIIDNELISLSYTNSYVYNCINVADGKCTFDNMSGTSVKVSFRNGVRHGPRIFYRPDKTIAYVINYVNGVFTGVVKVFNIEGKLIKVLDKGIYKDVCYYNGPELVYNL